MTVRDLSKKQFEELKEHYAWEIAEDTPDFWDGYEISDLDVIRHYSGVDFCNDDFFCTAGMNDEQVRFQPVNDFVAYVMDRKSSKDYWLQYLLENIIMYVGIVCDGESSREPFISKLADIIPEITEEEIECFF